MSLDDYCGRMNELYIMLLNEFILYGMRSTKTEDQKFRLDQTKISVVGREEKGTIEIIRARMINITIIVILIERSSFDNLKTWSCLSNVLVPKAQRLNGRGKTYYKWRFWKEKQENNSKCTLTLYFLQTNCWPIHNTIRYWHFKKVQLWPAPLIARPTNNPINITYAYSLTQRTDLRHSAAPVHP